MKSYSFISSSIFSSAKTMANSNLSNRFRLISLLQQAAKKLSSIEDKRKLAAEAKEKMQLMSRLISAFVIGEYRTLPWKSALSIVAAIVYFVNPADVIPDIIPFSGLVDDFSVLVWTYSSLQSELDKFSQWENSKTSY